MYSGYVSIADNYFRSERPTSQFYVNITFSNQQQNQTKHHKLGFFSSNHGVFYTISLALLEDEAAVYLERSKLLTFMRLQFS